MGYLGATLKQVFTHACRADMSLRDVTIARDGKRGYTVQVTSRTGSTLRNLGDFKKSELRLDTGQRWLAFASSRRPLWQVPHVLGVGGCRWKSQNRKIVPLSLCQRNFKLKGSKKFRTWTKKSLSVFRISRSYVLCIYVMNILCTFPWCVYIYIYIYILLVMLDCFK